jgi:hypothetical protein
VSAIDIKTILGRIEAKLDDGSWDGEDDPDVMYGSMADHAGH